MKKAEPLFEQLQMCLAITSDNHMDIRAKNVEKRVKTVRKTLTDVQTNFDAVDAYITVGDMTSRALPENWAYARQCFEGLKPAKKIFFTQGNHDTWHPDGEEAALKAFYENVQAITGETITKPYYERTVNGYHILFLGSTLPAENEDCAAFEEEMFPWLESALENAAADGKPIFVFCHQSVNGNHGLPRTWSEKEDPTWSIEIGGIGKQSDRVKEILKKHKNLFFFSGHSHMGLNGEKSAKKNGYSTVEEHDGVTYINLPCLTRPNHHGEDEKTGNGLVVEVYGDKVVFRPRNFPKKKFNKKVPLQNGKPYYEVSLK